MSAPAKPDAQLTLITATRPATLSKSAKLDPTGALIRKGGGVLVEGQAEIRAVADLSALAGILEHLTPDQALTFGIPAKDARVMSRRAYQAAGRPPGVITRTRDCIKWPPGPGVMMLDHDADTAEGQDRDALVALIRSAAPGLAGAAMLWWPSASSHICDARSGADLTGLRGQRLYLMVADAADIPRAGAALVDRLWAAGHGRIAISAAGAALERCLVDASVWTPEHLDFAAGAVCGSGLEQRRGPAVLLPGDMAPIDTAAALPSDPGVADAAAKARAEAKAAAKGEITAARERFVETMAQQMTDAGDTAAAPETLRAITRRALDHGVLCGDYPIEVETKAGGFETLTVGRILDDRSRYHGRLTRDPLEPGYDGGRAKGRLYLLDARPTLHSFAHGGRSFRLIRAPFHIDVLAGRTAEATDAAQARLATDGATFAWGGRIATTAQGRIEPLDEYGLAHHIAGIVQFRKTRLDRDGAAVVVDIDPPPALLRQLLTPGLVRGLTPLEAVITAPTLRADGSMLDRPGYDRRTGLLLDPLGVDIPAIPSAPDIAQARDALALLMAPFRDFPFIDGHARGALLAALLTVAVRPALPTAPAFAFDAPVQGAGKTLLASCVGALALGRAPEIWPHVAGRDDEETRKRLFTALRSGAAALVWDNVTGVLDSAALAAALTAPVLIDRVLGKSESQALPNRALILLTGNNLALAGDMPRRVIPCRIDPVSATPFARSFAHDPLAAVLADRMALIAAALTVIRGALTAPPPPPDGRTASFDAWDDLVRRAVRWAGGALSPGDYGDPMDLICDAQGKDPEQEALGALLTALRDLFGEDWFSAREAVQAAARAAGNPLAGRAEQDLAEAVTDLARDKCLSSTCSMGKLLSFRQGRPARDLRVAARPGRDGRSFRIETIEAER